VPLEQITARLREEFGAVLAGFSEDELALLARVINNNEALRQSHQLGSYDGDMLLLASGVRMDPDDPQDAGAAGNAGDAGDAGADPELSGPDRWRPHVTGQITEVVLPCRHVEMMQPAMLQQAWNAIAAWMDRR
jgi:hypothetical protein